MVNAVAPAAVRSAAPVTAVLATSSAAVALKLSVIAPVLSIVV